MMRLMTALSLPGLLLAAQPAFAAPPAEAKPLSEIVKMLEDGGKVAHVTEIEWDDRGGYWEVDYMQTEGGKVEVKLDPVSGQPNR
jgi:hypothetical protein